VSTFKQWLAERDPTLSEQLHQEGWRDVAKWAYTVPMIAATAAGGYGNMAKMSGLMPGHVNSPKVAPEEQYKTYRRKREEEQKQNAVELGQRYAAERPDGADPLNQQPRNGAAVAYPQQPPAPPPPRRRHGKKRRHAHAW